MRKPPFILMLCLFLASASTSLFGDSFYVNGDSGHDSAGGRVPEDALKTIQAAIDIAQPGDQIWVGPGLYHETIILTRGGTVDQPLEIIAQDGGCYQTVLSGAVPEVRSGKVSWELVDHDLGLYRIPLDYRPVQMLGDSVNLPPYERLDDLKAFHFVDDDYPGNTHGFTWDASEKYLYVRLNAGGKYGAVDPNDATMAVGPPTAGGRWGNQPNRPDNFLIALKFSGSAHVILDGFTFETPGLAGVYSEADDLVVRNSWFYGCRYGVAGKEDGSTARVRVEHCFYTQFPVYTDIEEIITVQSKNTSPDSPSQRRPQHWQRKAGFLPVTGGLQRPYSYETGLIRRIGREWVIRENWVWESFEAFSSGSVSNSSHSIIEKNRIERIGDNAFETEEHARDLTIRGNMIIDAFEPFSWQPLSGVPLPGPIYLYDNVCLQTPGDVDLWEDSTSRGGVFKIGIKYDRFWTDGRMGEIPEDVTPAPGGFWVVHNTIVAPYKRLFTSLNREGRRFEHFFFLNNILLTGQFSVSRQPNGPEGIQYRNNIVSFGDATPEGEEIAEGLSIWEVEASAVPKAILPHSRSAVYMPQLLADRFHPSQLSIEGSDNLSLPLPEGIPQRMVPGATLPSFHAGPIPRSNAHSSAIPESGSNDGISSGVEE
ncbi:hypothetical protein [Puniceicoccus vermicola]|uniref:Right handed beta helix domain-containing protein n=1 Tax=Puniceicoccus vermicola TaxID=388746 RepID=A0A7X1B2F4_9BACT|nr:hypothetical protein [Puniceicoccus vermicola]MBC2604405.1 hypothetical protein [Puniceicoccus vermicola]